LVWKNRKDRNGSRLEIIILYLFKNNWDLNPIGRRSLLVEEKY